VDRQHRERVIYIECAECVLRHPSHQEAIDAPFSKELEKTLESIGPLQRASSEQKGIAPAGLQLRPNDDRGVDGVVEARDEHAIGISPSSPQTPGCSIRSITQLFD